MSFVPVSTGREAPEIEDGMYTLLCRQASPVDLPEPDEWGKKAKIRFLFEVEGLTDEDGEPVTLDPQPNRTLSDGGGGRYPASTFYKICTALGVKIDGGVNTDDLAGKKCRGVISTVEGKWPQITQYLPLPKTKAAASARPVASQKASNGAPPEPIGEWWAEARKGGRSQAMVTEASKRMYKGLTPIQLDAEQRAVLLVAIERGSVPDAAECAEGEHDLAFNEDGVMVCRKCAADVSEEAEA